MLNNVVTPIKWARDFGSEQQMVSLPGSRKRNVSEEGGT